MARLRVALAGLVVVGLAALTSCSAIGDRVGDALHQAASATASASIALQLLDDGRALTPLADTTLGDALTELESAAGDLSQTGPIGDEDQADVRDEALDAIRAATDAVLDARETVASHGDLAADIQAVDEATDRIHSLEKDLP